LHARRLLGHHRKVTCTFLGIERQGLQGFNKAREHRQWRSDFV